MHPAYRHLAMQGEIDIRRDQIDPRNCGGLPSEITICESNRFDFGSNLLVDNGLCALAVVIASRKICLLIVLLLCGDFCSCCRSRDYLQCLVFYYWV